MKAPFNLSTIGEDAIDLKYQLMLLSENGSVLDSNDRLFTASRESFDLFKEEVFYGMIDHFESLDTDEPFKLECVETDFYGRQSIFDFTIRVIQSHGVRGYLLSIHDLEDVYQRVVDLRQERNEALALSRQLEVAYTKMEEAYQRESDTRRELEEMQLQVLYQEKMASVGQLATGMAHEINNPLNYILNGIVILKDSVNQVHETKQGRMSNRESFDQVVSIIEQGAKRIHDVVRELQAFNDFGSSKRKWVNVHDNLNQVIDLLSPQLKEHIKITKSYDETFDMVCCIPRKINQVFLNLLTNASSFIPADRAGEIEISTEWEEHWLEVSFRDNGVGIPEEIQKHIFDPFYTTKSAGSGKGLGLSVSYKIVEEHGGQLMFDSDAQSTIFRVVLPLGDDIDLDSP